MTKEHSENLLFVAVLLSLAIHAALMFSVRGKVMTRIVRDDLKVVKRVSLVAERASSPEMQLVRDEDIEDEPAQKGSPQVEISRSLQAGALDAFPVKEAFEHFNPGNFEIAKHEIETPPREMFRVEPVEIKTKLEMPQGPVFEFSKPEVGGRASMIVSHDAKIPFGAGKPSFPAGVPPIHSAADEIPKMAAAGKSAKGQSFIPADTVYEEVDRKFVEAEKDAVKDLLLSTAAEDMASRVKMDVKSQVHGQWIYFKLSISDIGELSVVPKDFVLLIDASGSIGSERMRSLRKSAKDLLRSAMNSHDRFNIVAFRDRYSYAFKSWQRLDIRSLAAADDFIGSLAAFGRTDVFSTIESVLTLPRNPSRPLIALVVTDAEPNIGVRQTAKIISKFSALNEGLVSVYMYGVKNDANRELINVLTKANRGESLVYVGARKTAGKGIAQLSERFRDPVLSDITHKFSAGTLVESYPKRLKNLYRDSPVELYARTPLQTKEIYFQIKALNGDKPYEALFKVSFRADMACDEMLKEAFETERDIYMMTEE